MNPFKVGDKILSIEFKDPTTYREYTVTKVGKDTVTCGSSENTLYSAFCWPIRLKDEVIAIVTETKRLQDIVDNRMKLIYELKNAIARGEK
jgi:hypothetical protein